MLLKLSATLSGTYFYYNITTRYAHQNKLKLYFFVKICSNLTLFWNYQVVSDPLLIGLLLYSHNEFILLICCKQDWILSVMGSGFGVNKYIQSWKRVAAATWGNSLPSPPIDQTNFRINIFTINNFTTTYNI